MAADRRIFSDAGRRETLLRHCLSPVYALLTMSHRSQHSQPPIVNPAAVEREEDQVRYIRWFDDVGASDVPLVGGKNASLGEMLRELSEIGVRVPQGFAVTAEAYRQFLRFNSLEERVTGLLEGLSSVAVKALTERSQQVRELIHAGEYPEEMKLELLAAYYELGERSGVPDPYVAVRSSATAEDLPTASFAGQQESFLMVHGKTELLDAVKRALASLHTARAVSYRVDMGFEHGKVALSVGVQHMVRSDRASSGVAFTLDPETGHDQMIYLTASWGLGENVVQGRVQPDAYYVHKAKLKDGFRPLVWKKLGLKELTLVYDQASNRLVNKSTEAEQRGVWALTDEEILLLARWASQIEAHYSAKRGETVPMDIEWAKDGLTGELFVVQARPETVHSQQTELTTKVFSLEQRSRVLVEGLAVGSAVAVGKTHLIEDPRDMDEFQAGEVLVTGITDPDWEPIMKRAAAIVTERGSRTSHAAIVARELGIPAVVGAHGAREALPSGSSVTVSTVEGETGKVYEGSLPYRVEEVDLLHLERPQTPIMLNLGEPEKALRLAQLPTHGVGLARLEFIFAGHVGVHPLALTRYDLLPLGVKRRVDELTKGYARRSDFFVDRLAQGIGLMAAAFWPRPVILRFSDFKTNEYAGLLGGAQFEPEEENPMLGWRGASRYYHRDYREGFLLEVEAVKRVRQEFGLGNLKVMVPFCRTPEEGKRVLEVMAEGGLERGKDDLEVYVMAELPSNVFEAEEFAAIFDGFSIGSNDLTQLIVGVDRDSDRVAPLFDERRAGVKRACRMLIREAHKRGLPVGICGQAPSDYPEFAAFLVEESIDSISLNPDSLLGTIPRMVAAERQLAR